MVEYLLELLKGNVTFVFVIALFATLFLMFVCLSERWKTEGTNMEEEGEDFHSPIIPLFVSLPFLLLYLVISNKGYYNDAYPFFLIWAAWFTLAVLGFAITKYDVRKESEKKYRKYLGLPEPG